MLEQKINEMNSCDIYLPEKDLIIQIDGPCHFYNRKNQNNPFIPIS